MSTHDTDGSVGAGLDPRGLKVFVSYSRRDLDFANQLVAALEAVGYTVTIDRKGIHGAERWEQRLGQLIRESDTVLFVLTPASAASEVCHWEVEQALEAGKRIVPLLASPLSAGCRPHDALRDLNYIHFQPEPAFPEAGWGNGFARLHAALCVDVGWIREHTRVAEMAARWQAAAPAPDLLARGSELAALQAWRDARPANTPALSAAQRAFLQASEEAEAARTDHARRQIEDIRAAQAAEAAALAESRHAQAGRERALKVLLRRTLVGIAAAALLSTAVGIAAWIAWRNGQAAELALAQITEERQLQDRLLQLLRNRPTPTPPYTVDSLARRYEGESPEHVGTDFIGGVYYGSFRIQAGLSLEAFLGFLARWDPALHDVLQNAGGSAAAARQDPRFVAAWRALASQPGSAARFADLQTEFVTREIYARLVARLASPGAGAVRLDAARRSVALRAVLFSIAVQYGPSTRLVQDALAELGDPGRLTDAEIIKQLYRFRDKVDTYFPGIQAHSPNFANLIRERNRWELRDALYLLSREDPRSASPSPPRD